MSEQISISVDTVTGITKVSSKLYPAAAGVYLNESLAAVHIGLAQLKQFKRDKTSEHPLELEWEIRLYQFIIAQPKPHEVAEEYMRARGDGKRSKREAVKFLGWPV